MRRALNQRDASFDHAFYAGVTTTNVFCRPSCPARKPLPRNVRFFATSAEALAAGFRPCLRCRPLDLPGAPAWVRSLIDEIDASPDRRISAAQLRERGIDPATARRVFMKHFGLTFQGYARLRRLGRALSQIRDGVRLDDVVFEAGFESHSGFRSAFGKAFGGAPRRAAPAETIVTRLYDSPLGSMLVAATRSGVCLLEFTDRRMLEFELRTVRKRFRAAIVPGDSEILRQAVAELDEYFGGMRREFMVPLAAPGSAFQEQVWTALRRVPYGETRSYEQLARTIGRPDAIRAVARANGFNRIAIMIPCHRILTKDWQLGGYGGGIWRKHRLLELEASGIQPFRDPEAL
ncbi:MAG: bifunctional transcriptional activator/DNA repair enzyme AdaA [Thermoanaerobaculia bacterium]